MAESLGTAWQEIHFILGGRKAVVDKNFLFKGHLQDYLAKANSLKLQIEKATQYSHKNPNTLMKELAHSKRKMLEASAFSIQEGEQLLKSLHQMWQQTSPGMTPQHVRSSLSRSIEQVELEMERIHDKRMEVMKLLQMLKVKYEKSSDLLKFQDKLEALELKIKEKQDRVDAIMYNLGGSLSDVNGMIEQTSALLQESQDLTDEVSVANDDLHKRYDLNSDDNRNLSLLAFKIAEKAAIYSSSLEHRMGILHNALAFFKDAADVDVKLNEIEATLNALDECKNNDFVHQLTSLKNIIVKIKKEISDQGEALIADNNDDQSPSIPSKIGTNVKGVQGMLNSLRLKSDNLIKICMYNLNYAKRSSRTWNNFHSKLEEFSMWIDNIMRDKIHNHKNVIGNSLDEAFLFLKDCKEILGNVQVKMYELEGMKGALKVMLNDEQSNNKSDKTSDELIAKVQGKIRSLSRTLEERITISSKYVKFLKLADELKNEMEKLEDEFLVTNTGSQVSSDLAQHYEARRLTIQNLHLQVCNTSKNIIQDLNDENEAFLNKEPIIDNINRYLANLNRAQSILIEMWTTISAQIKSLKEDANANRIVDSLLQQVKDVEDKICPLMNTDQEPGQIVSSLESSYSTLSKAKALVSGLKELAEDVKNNHSDLQTKTVGFQDKIFGFESLLKRLIAFVKHLAEVKMIAKDIRNKQQRPLSCNLVRLNLIIMRYIVCTLKKS